MSTSEMRAELGRLRAEVGRLSAENERLAAEAAEAERRRAELERLLSRLAAELRSEKGIVKRYNLDRFVSTKDNAFRAAARAADAKRPAAGAKRGPKKGSRNFAGLDLEALSSGNEPLVVDPAEPLEGLVRVGERECYSIELRRARIEVRKVVYRSYRRPDGSIAEPPTAAPIPGSPAGPGLLADLQFCKYALGVPGYRYVGWSALSGLPVSTQTFCNWARGAAEAERPVYEAILSSVPSIGAGECHADETPLKMAKEGKNGYLFAFSADGAKGKVRALRFSKTRSTEGVVDGVLGGFGGVVTVDGYAGYDRLEAGMPVQRCLAHARRKWAELAKSGDKGAEPAVAAFDAVFADERAAREASDGSPGSLLKARLAGPMPGHVEALRAMMRSMGEGSPKGSPRKRAADYFLNMEEGLLLFMSDGRASLDNNAAERCVKKAALARRNFLFVQGEAGGESAAIALTLIETAAANRVEPMGYLKWVLSNRAAAEADPKSFLPWSDKVPEELRF